jgi:hypothetical protein
MYLELLEQVEKERQAYGLSMQPPASADEITTLKKKAKKSLAYDLDENYAGFLRRRNGLVWNGFFVYAAAITPIAGYSDRFIDGFVEANLQYWEADANQAFITFGHTGDARYVLNLSKKKFEEIDSVALDAIATFNSFEEMLCHILKRSLQ